jgi:hypothetical protein
VTVASIRPAGEAGFRPIGACGFPVDPALPATTAPVFWRPEIAPAVVVRLASAPAGGPRPLSLPAFEVQSRIGEDGLYLRLSQGPQLLLTAGADPYAPLAVVLPLDEAFRVRAAAADALYLMLTADALPADRMSGQRRQRVRQMLRALDARQGGASYRDIAVQVLNATVADSASWRTSTVRDVAIRLCRGAFRLMRGGYLAFLRTRR